MWNSQVTALTDKSTSVKISIFKFFSPRWMPENAKVMICSWIHGMVLLMGSIQNKNRLTSLSFYCFFKTLLEEEISKRKYFHCLNHKMYRTYNWCLSWRTHLNYFKFIIGWWPCIALYNSTCYLYLYKFNTIYI